jgi:hypothetical protein
MFFGDIRPPWFSRYLSELRLTRSFRPCGRPAAVAPLESSWNLAPRLPAMIHEGRALESIARSALAPRWFVVEHVCRPDNILPEGVF